MRLTGLVVAAYSTLHLLSPPQTPAQTALNISGTAVYHLTARAVMALCGGKFDTSQLKADGAPFYHMTMAYDNGIVW